MKSLIIKDSSIEVSYFFVIKLNLKLFILEQLLLNEIKNIKLQEV